LWAESLRPTGSGVRDQGSVSESAIWRDGLRLEGECCAGLLQELCGFPVRLEETKEIRQAQNGRQETSLSNLVQAISAARVRRRDEGCRI